MYPPHWGLSETPFRTRIDPRFFHSSLTHEEALARLHFLVDDGRRLGLLTGRHGSGKSLVFKIFAQQVRRSGLPVARLNMLGLDPCEFVWELAAQFGLCPAPGLRPGVLWPMVADRLSEFRYQQTPAIVLIDDADQSDPTAFDQVVRLVQIDPAPDVRLTVVVSGRPDQLSRLGESVLERVELRIELEPWAPEETAAYLCGSLAKAGRTTPLFAEPAVSRLHELACGVPRRVTQLADLALLAGASGDLDTIDTQTVEAAYGELGTLEV